MSKRNVQGDFMGIKRLPKTDEFVAIDEYGNGVLIVEYTEMIGTDTFEEPAEIPGLKRYMTAANQAVNANGDGTYRVLGSDVILRRSV